MAPDVRVLSYDEFYAEGQTATEVGEAYTSHNTRRLDVEGVVEKLQTTDYVCEERDGRPPLVES